jgi:hypothetical protein
VTELGSLCFEYGCGLPAGGCSTYCAYCTECCAAHSEAAAPLPSPSDFECAPCGYTFKYLTDFDAHQEVGYPAPVACKAPWDLSLVQRERDGVWMSPEALAKLAGASERMTAMRRAA